jgi:type I restriction enzyme S subunit
LGWSRNLWCLLRYEETYHRTSRAAVALADYPKLMVCDKLYRLRPQANECKPEFLASYLGTRAVRGQIELSATGASSSMLNIGQDTILDMPTAVPPIVEQLIIMAFLDRETAKIDALVEEQRRLIELLKEKRQAVILHAVTKGLDPNAPMKDSSVEWLGQVPAHWEVVRVKWVAQTESGHTPDKKIAAYWENCTIPWVSLHDTKYLKDNDYIAETAQYVNDCAA